MKTKTKKTPSTMYDKFDKIIDKLDDLSCDVVDGSITANAIYDRLETIRNDIVKIQDSL